MTVRSPARRVLARTATALLALPLLACGATTPGGGAPPTGDAPPADLAGFYGQAIEWEECAQYATTSIEGAVFAATEGAECGRLDVPSNYADPTGATAEIAVLRVSARGEPTGSLVYNPGGPGGSGLFGAAAMAMTLAENPLTEKFDLVGFDPRGVGASTPAIDCYSDEEADRHAVPLTAFETSVQWTSDDTRALVERCAAGSGGAEFLAQVGTRDVARDIDVLRAVLGDEELNFLGQSYGTRLGAVYAEQFPQNVRAMVLDGGIDPKQGTVERRVDAYTGFQGAFERMAAFCATQQDCPLGTDPANATQAFQEIVRPLLNAPVPALHGEIGFDEAVSGVISGLYDQNAWPRIIAGLTEITQGRGDELLQLGYDFAMRDPEGAWPNFYEANYAVNCMDEERLSPEEGAELRAAIFAAAPFMDPGIELVGARDGCEHWPAEPNLGYPYADDVSGLTDTLVVSITGDPTTPHAGALSLADSLGSALLTVEGEGHGVVGTGANACVNDIVAAYLIDLELPGEGATCSP
ncbi:alpha/beta hydrolase [Actinoalloteichus hymeniacidonis]|uniref:Alpha/beta hydrolase family protein n=1 Tax=Actinoalloteichus hymeniacidonis TaxID=340345 RepID=A0AAC9HT12_9PSEU|nr:alpha/beta hydrolase [Actinoalloteichus hymeniacidonis]AOS63950.1 alpha/beta hydrolase family protein [Actinoalloteichus hymeniacidonis]MBB5907993.1 pimeloyl-ACP methyl ester carboxylesterase [Actinoalloteichus hymeniacidonis]